MRSSSGTLLPRDEHRLRRRQRMRGHVLESRAFELPLKFGKRVGITRVRAGEHRQAECGGHRRRDPIGIRHELEDDDASAGLERAVHLREECSAG